MMCIERSRFFVIRVKHLLYILYFGGFGLVDDIVEFHTEQGHAEKGQRKPDVRVTRRHGIDVARRANQALTKVHRNGLLVFLGRILGLFMHIVGQLDAHYQKGHRLSLIHI